MKTVRVSCPGCGEKFFVVSQSPSTCPMCGAIIVSTGKLVDHTFRDEFEPQSVDDANDSSRLAGIAVMFLALLMLVSVALCGLLHW